MILLEDADHIIGPRSNYTNDNNHNETWTHAKGIENLRNGEYAQPDLGLDHENGRA